ncbi:ABC transporter permease [Amycolatopsis rubida]|uniref:ABC transporter permease n=1 Tax=Amycolatopsis rubida TaxID=112413 RepID=A0ABX0BNW3_9PSEU|nr:MULTISPECIES: ABC transporter permease [Amycolatopsis]MYW91695.1 ABC transporter permease subunit [Amycolatopsis rubida]NEC56679.1 ABC transporter permease [Amycolatopsis rubida]OAP20430.1 Glutathione transport system permease protein GsiC [Amycolatopsis sp. M39]
MRALILRRLLISVPLVIAVSWLTFLLQHLAPGDTARAVLGENYTPEGYARLRAQLGLDQSLPVQYWHWLTNALHGDFGVSPINGLDVGAEIGTRLGVTLSLIVVTTVVAAALGIALGSLSAIRGGPLGRIVDVLSLAGFALPSFWLALVLVTIFAVTLRILPATGYTPFAESPGGWTTGLVLPVAALAVHGTAAIAKQTRSGLLDTLSRDFVVTLRANGASERSILFRHALRNAAIPVVTVIGLVFVSLLNGTVLVEAVFAMPGLGGLAVQSATQHDVPAIQAVAVTFTLVVVVVNLLVDLAYGWLDPKVRVR